MTGSKSRTRVWPEPEPAGLYPAAAFREHFPCDPQPDPGPAAGRGRPETWPVVNNLDNFRVAIEPLGDLNMTVWPSRTRRIGQDIGQRPAQPCFRGRHYVPWLLIWLAQTDQPGVGQLLGVDRVPHQPRDIDWFRAGPGSWPGQHVLNDLRNPLRLGLDLLEAAPDPIGQLWIRQCRRHHCEHRGDGLAQVMSGPLDRSRSQTAIPPAFLGSRFPIHSPPSPVNGLPADHVQNEELK